MADKPISKRPVRIQRKRTKGWKMPENTVSVTRPGPFGNPFLVRECRQAGFQGTDEEIARRCVEAFRAWVDSPYWRTNWDGEEAERARGELLRRLPELRGKNLACWCALDQPCHADVLLELANAEAP
jgi:hypothetical protein